MRPSGQQTGARENTGYPSAYLERDACGHARAGGRHEWAAARVASLFFFKFLTRTDEAPRNLHCVNLGITGWAPGDCGALLYAPPKKGTPMNKL